MLRCLVGALAVLSVEAFAQPCLVQGDSGPLALQIQAGVMQPRLTAVDPAARITVVLFPQSIAEADRRRTALEVAALYRTTGKEAAFRVMTFNGEAFVPLGSAVGSAAAWQKVIQDALTPASVERITAPPKDLYALLAGASVDLGGEWSSVLLVGLPPEIEPELREYALPWLASHFCARKLRVSYWTPDGQGAEFWNGVARRTAGASHLENLTEFAAWRTSGRLFETTWPEAGFNQGFSLDRGTFIGSEISVIRSAPSAVLPTPAEYGNLRRVAREATTLVALERLEPAQVQHVRELLAEALRINPLDVEALRAGADYYARFQDFQTAARLLGLLSTVQPWDAALDARLGHYLFVSGDLVEAERRLLRARENRAGGAGVSEELARIHLLRKDDAGAVPFLDEVLTLTPGRSDLWFARSDLATRLNDWLKAAESLEKGVGIEKANLDRRTSLVRLYLERGAAPRALPHVRAVVAALPADAALRREYAGFLDRLGLPDEALPVWKKAVEADPASELAHFRTARLLLDKGDNAEALAAADSGILVVPVSARLRLVRADALERQGRHYEARDSLRTAARSIRDPELLGRLAEMEDVSGAAAASAYAAAVESQSSAADSGLTTGWLERGLEVALRDGDAKSADSFRARLTKSGRGGAAAWLTPKPETTAATAIVPGGLEALAFIAHLHPTAPRRFFAEYSRNLVVRTGSSNPKHNEAFLQSIREYFQLLASLKALGVPKGGGVEIEIATADKRALQKSAKILELLGWTLRARKEGLRLEAGEKVSQARRQETASALAIDEIAIRQAIEAGRPFKFTIEDGAAPVLLGEAKWLDTFVSREKPIGGFAAALAHDMRVAKAYAALSTAGPRVAAALTPGADLKVLVEKHADLLYSHASAFALQGAKAAAPGGPAAEPVWEKVLGTPTSNPGRFFRALMEKDEGRLLAFFHLLSQLDSNHQRFFTLNSARTIRFYELFRASPDMMRGPERQTQTTPFVEFLREIPLDDELHVLFPGSPEVWMLAKGKSSSTSQAVKMAKKLSRVTAPEQEDEILIRLAQTRYTAMQEKLTECDNFVAVVRIDRHRTDPLSETSALLLAQHFATAGAAYPYFTTLTDLDEKHFERFFNLVNQWREMSWQQLNPVLAQFDSLLEMLCLARETNSLTGKAAAELFGLVCERFGKAAAPSDYTVASLETVRDLLARTGSKDLSDPDAAVERILFGSGAPAAWVGNGEQHTLDTVTLRGAAYRKVLSEQSVPSLRTLLEFDRRLRELADGKGSASEHVKAIEQLQGQLPSVPIDKKMKVSAEDHKLLAEYDSARIPELIAHLKQRLSRKKVNVDDIRKLRIEFLAALSQHAHVALSGIIYAYFLNPEDLLVAEDPLFLRKHRFVDIGGGRKIFPTSILRQASEGAGSYVAGGFGQFYLAAGEVAVAGAKNPNGAEVAAVQVGSLRATDWSHLQLADLRLLSIRLRLAREWILHAGIDDKLLAALSEETLDLLAPPRRAQLLDAISMRDWESAFQALTLGDLYALSDRYLGRFKSDSWQSPVTMELRKFGAAVDQPRLLWLGGSAVELMGCNHSHLVFLGPYEQYERLMFPQKLAERAAEFKLSLAEVAGRVGLPPPVLGAIAEPLVMRLLAKANMTDMHDWRAAIGAYAALDEPMLESALEQHK